ncbi:MAG: hypothetical protein ACWGQW_06505 [bacterium]
MDIDLTEEEVVELLYLAKAELELSRQLADRLILHSKVPQAGWNAHERGDMLERLVEKLGADVDLEDWE